MGRYDRICSNSVLPHSRQLQDWILVRVWHGAVASLCFCYQYCDSTSAINLVWHRLPLACTYVQLQMRFDQMLRWCVFYIVLQISRLHCCFQCFSRLAVWRRVTSSRFWFPNSRRDWRTTLKAASVCTKMLSSFMLQLGLAGTSLNDQTLRCSLHMHLKLCYEL